MDCYSMPFWLFIVAITPFVLAAWFMCGLLVNEAYTLIKMKRPKK